ncbi:MAG: hypothetical protein HXY27_09305 [Hydrogenophilaceae bacterium]|jgi:hypothetical protein|nr:hypothetical protein [Hydrogenophilaceae bacterium]
MRLKFKAPRKPRNPLVVLVKQRKAGSHAPNMKTLRQKANMALKKQLKKPEQ